MNCIPAETAATMLEEASFSVDTDVRIETDDSEHFFRLVNLTDDDGIAFNMHRGDAELMAAAPDLAQTVIDQAEQIERLKTALTDHLRQEADQ